MTDAPHDLTRDILINIQNSIAALRGETLNGIAALRGEMNERFDKANERFEKAEADIARVHADLAKTNATVTQMHADVLETKSIGREVAVRLTAIEKRISRMEDA